MNHYLRFNLVLAVAFAIVCIVLGKAVRFRQRVGISARVATLVTALGYPWDFFAGYLHAWGYPTDPGPRLYGVPANDLLFMWLCTYLACNILLVADERKSRGD